jgi:hypothetical protein
LVRIQPPLPIEFESIAKAVLFILAFTSVMSHKQLYSEQSYQG